MKFSSESYRYLRNPFDAFLKRFEDIQQYWIPLMKGEGLAFSKVFSERHIHNVVFYITLFIALYGLVEIVSITENKVLYVFAYIFCLFPLVLMFSTIYLTTGLELILDMIKTNHELPDSIKKRASLEYIINRDLDAYEAFKYFKDREFRQNLNSKANSKILYLTADEKKEILNSIELEVDEHLTFIKKSMYLTEFLIVTSLVILFARSIN